MRENDWQNVKKIFLAALETSAPERARFITESGGENTEIIKEVESLLAAHESDTGFIETPAVALASILSDSAANITGKIFANYKIIREIGAGGVSDDGLPFLAMEFIEGEAITKFAEQKKLNLEDRLKLFLKVGAGGL